MEAPQPKQSQAASRTRRERLCCVGTACWFVFVIVNVAAADFVTGNQSVDQIFFGACLGLWLGYFCNAFVREPLDRHITKLLDGEYHALGYSRLFKTLLVIVVFDFILCSALFTFIDRQEHYIYGR